MVKVRVRLLPEDRVVEVEAGEGVTVDRLLRVLGLSRESHIVLVDGKPIPESERVPPGSDVVVVRVVSGG